jgi:hypothetical protein
MPGRVQFRPICFAGTAAKVPLYRQQGPNAQRPGAWPGLCASCCSTLRLAAVTVMVAVPAVPVMMFLCLSRRECACQHQQRSERKDDTLHGLSPHADGWASDCALPLLESLVKPSGETSRRAGAPSLQQFRRLRSCWIRDETRSRGLPHEQAFLQRSTNSPACPSTCPRNDSTPSPPASSGVA